MSQTPLIQTLPLFPLLDQKLITLLKSISLADWEKQTIAPLWKVKDVAAHLLDGNIRSLSMLRDRYFGTGPGNIQSYQDLLSYLNGLNADWVKALQRVSPTILIDLLESTGKQYYDFLQTLDPYEKATFSVAWAGEQESYNWFHIAREYTEKWHHQQQIRYAVGLEKELYSREFYYPYLETSMRALPYHYREVHADKGTLLKFTVTGEGGGDWFLLYSDSTWALEKEVTGTPLCEVIIPDAIAWRVFTKGISKQEAVKSSSIEGTDALGHQIFNMLAVMA